MSKEKVRVCEQINAAPQAVWDLVGNFQSIMDWFPGIVESRAEGEGIGALRHLTMSDGSTISDRLVAIEEGISYSYEIVGGEVPMQNYLGTVSVKPLGSGTELCFEGSFDVADEMRGEVLKFITGIYADAFKNAKQLIEG